MATVANITRRHALKLFPAGIAAAGVPAAALAVEPVRDPLSHVQYLAEELAKAMGALDPERQYEALFNESETAIFVVPAPRPSAAVFDGPDYYEVELKSGLRPILWVERSGKHYVGAHAWGGKFETNPRKYRDDQIRIIRKMVNYAQNWGA
ncbi:unnamed protein product [Ciceribacter sp. T2.26MG-112.2]|uniref:hypothetical protein n=1 Tax=Ciceribacter sp. T2.26MG-112.2 TaxID=3137154 RepID=UPI000E1825C3|nr:hypothetical protein [Ciceribacter naphthalenivorans]SSC73067.1 unnamed protein product [Ciceribacter naphthalenivorans]